MKKLEKMGKELNDNYFKSLADAIYDEMGIRVESNWDIVIMRMVTTRVSGKAMTQRHHNFISAFEKGYVSAKNQVYAASLK